MAKHKAVFLPAILVSRGDQVQASYREEISFYKGNPLIESLPPRWSEDDAINLLQYYPEYDESDRLLPACDRLHLIQNALEFFEPLPVHIDLEGRISRLIRFGYRKRNPIAKEFTGNMKQWIEALRSGECTRRPARSSSMSMTILGISGIGKSTAVETILSLYPQVIHHSKYIDRTLTLAQLVWLKLDCPKDGSIKGLCLNFFQAVDDLLGTSYYSNYAKGRRTVDELVPDLARVAANQSLGLLVIDEIQNLSLAKSGGHQKMLNFFVQLINTIGLPVVLIGTYKAWSVVGEEFRQIRRGTGQGDLVWDRMNNDEAWYLFTESLWRYQYVQKPTVLTEELNKSLYWECQGITDFAIKIYMLAQVRAITTGVEKITKGIIQSVAKDCLKTAREVLDALKEGSLEKLRSCGDIQPIAIEPFIEEALDRMPSNSPLSSLCLENEKVIDYKNQPRGLDENSKQQSSSSKVEGEIDSSELEKEIEQTGRSEAKIKPKRKGKMKSEKCSKESIFLEIKKQGLAQGVTAYEALKNKGLIRSAIEFTPVEVKK